MTTPTGPVISWLHRLLEYAVLLVAIGLLLSWAWQLIRPLVPVIAITIGIGVIGALVVRRRNRSW